MSVRSIILLLALPLFLLLAAVNSLLLYREDTFGMDAGLREQALAAAVTVAEFATVAPDSFTDLASPRRRDALRTVRAEVTGLKALYLAAPGRPPLNLLDSPIPATRHDPVPARPVVLVASDDTKGYRLITALAPIGRSSMVVAQIDAEPLARRTAQLRHLSIALIVGSAFLAILIGLIIARRVIGEFARTRAIIEADGGRPQGDALEIREIRDLADAVRLIDASVASELQRLAVGDEGDPAIGIAAARARHFPDMVMEHRGIMVSIRQLPSGSAGRFHVCKAVDGGIVFIIGEMEGEPAAALAEAVALKDYVLAGSPDEFAGRARQAVTMFHAGKSEIGELRIGTGGFVAIGLYGNTAAMRGYAERNPELDPDALTADLAALFPDAGVIAAACEKA